MAPDAGGRVTVRKTYKHYLNGEFARSESGRSYQPVPEVNVPRGSRKDLRDAVKAARAAFGGWASKTAYNRGQILYRAAEMLDGRRQQFVLELGGGRAARREVEQAVEALVWYAGWTDKLAQVAGTVNPVAGPYFNFTLPEPTGVVGIIAPDAPAFGGLVARLAPALAGGNTVVAIASEVDPRAALTLGEVMATSDLPAGTVNILSGRRSELLAWLASHMDVNAIDGAGCSPDQFSALEEAGAASVKRVLRSTGAQDLAAITGLMEFKTVWHPIGQ